MKSRKESDSCEVHLLNHNNELINEPASRYYAAGKREVVCIGANFSSVTRTVEGWEEVWLS